MNILFFLEPSIEFGNPLFRYATLRNSLTPQIKALQDEGATIVTVCSSTIAKQADRDGIDRHLGYVISVDPLEWVAGENSLGRSVRHLRNAYKAGEVERLAGIICPALPNGFKPDVVFSWESPADWVKEVFPDARLIYQTPGFFSRAPYAPLVAFDYGLLGRGAPIATTFISAQERHDLCRLREIDAAFLKSVSPTAAHIQLLRAEFSKVVLFPLQVDRYFMIDSVMEDGQTQFDTLIQLLCETPSDTALLVTNYKSKDAQSEVLTPQNLAFLRDRFPNFINLKDLNYIQNASQYLVPEVDGVVAISSSVGYQAAYWHKPLLSLGRSHITAFATAAHSREFFAQVDQRSAIDRDTSILNLLRDRHLSEEFLKNGPAYMAWLTKRIAMPFNEGAAWTNDLVGELLKGRRETEALRQLGYFEQVRSESSIEHCTELSGQIYRHEIISFDIFDTLLQRPFKSPSDLFALLTPQVVAITGIAGIDFKDERRLAERRAFEASIARNEGETT
ncbi:MAG: hypothetical protein JWQ11_2462, partial [Rhizobacter sp.]|nr:hypothetical protein [Rhizobacter sp.]